MLHIVIGPMFSGKTTFLSKIFDYSKSIYINHTFDTRGEIFYSHDPSILIKNGIKTDSLKDEDILDYDIIAIDESQFFTNIKETIIRWVEKYEKTLKKVIAAVHPTPAVCGLPKQSAKNFIRENEGYNREYYSGFLGELNLDLVTFKTAQTDLFVNLRCVKILKDKAQLFIGCGITKDSNPEAEYIETINKSMTMKKIIN
jgi:hypothetical protein